MKFAATLPASDIERAKAWYASVLQLEPIEITHSGDVWYEIGGTRLNIQVPDVEAVVGELKGRGAEFEHYDYGEAFRTVDGIATDAAGQKMAWLKDPEGNIISIGAR